MIYYFHYSASIIRIKKKKLHRCTKKQGTTDCYREAQGYRILPPVTVARVDTRNSFIFEHARVEIRAKFPRGDWIYPRKSSSFLFIKRKCVLR